MLNLRPATDALTRVKWAAAEGGRVPGGGKFERGTAGGTGPLPDDINLAERAAIAIELGRVPPAYAEVWAAFQRKPGHQGEADWLRAVDDAGLVV